MIWRIEAVLAHVHDGKAPPSMHGFKTADTRKPPFATLCNQTLHCLLTASKKTPLRLCSHRRWTRRKLSCRPFHRIFTKHILQSSPFRKNIVPRYPRLIPRLAIHLQALNIICAAAITTCCSNSQILPIAETDIHRFEPWSQDKKCSLARHGIKTDHLPLSEHEQCCTVVSL